MKTIQEMALEVGAIHIHERPKEFAIVGNEAITRFAALVSEAAIADEREKCAQLCETLISICYDTAGYTDCAAAIRARNNT